MKLNQADVATMLGITQQQYSRYEQGIQELPAHHAITLSRLYNTSVDYIWDLTDERLPHVRK